MNNNKKFFNDIIYFLILMAFIYLLVGFAAWDLNAKHWSMEARLMFAFWSPVISAVTLSTKRIYNDSI